MTLPRPRILLLTALVVLLLVVVVWWWTGRDQVAWSVDVPNANRVVDVDEGRVLVETFDEDLVVLDREDGDRLGAADLPAGSIVNQAALVPGGLVASWDDDGAHPVAQYDDGGRELWQRNDVERILGVGAEEAVVAVRLDDATVGLGAAGEEVWRAAGAGDLTGPRAEGRELAGTHVTLVTGSEPGALDVVDLDDGSVRGPLDTAGAKVDSLVYDGDAVLASLGDDRLVWSGGALDGLPDVSGGWFVAAPGDGAVAVANDEKWYGVDLAAGTVRALDPAVGADTIDPVDGQRIAPVRDGDDVRLVDIATGEDTATYSAGGDVLGAYSGNDAVLVVEDVGPLTRWRHLTNREDTGRLTIVDRDGESHGSWVSSDGAVINLYVADDHEALVVTKDPTYDDPDPHRVTLLGR